MCHVAMSMCVGGGVGVVGVGCWYGGIGGDGGVVVDTGDACVADDSVCYVMVTAGDVGVHWCGCNAVARMYMCCSGGGGGVDVDVDGV